MTSEMVKNLLDQLDAPKVKNNFPIHTDWTERKPQEAIPGHSKSAPHVEHNKQHTEPSKSYTSNIHPIPPAVPKSNNKTSDVENVEKIEASAKPKPNYHQDVKQQKPSSFVSSVLKNNESVTKNFTDEEGDSKYSSNKINSALQNLVNRNRNRILVIGVGGAGSNAVNRLHITGIKGAITVTANTDAYHLFDVNSHQKVILGENLTEGLGAGNDPVIGRAAAEESHEDLREVVSGADLVFVTAGMGGGTGTGAASVIADIAKDCGALVVGVCTLPFEMEGDVRINHALEGLREFYKACDTVIVIPNEKLLQLAPEMPIDMAFEVADEILIRAVKGIVNLVVTPAFVNVDFADIRQILKRGGSSVIGVGEASGENRIEEAMNESMANNLLDVKIMESRAALINISGGTNLSLEEIQRCVKRISEEIGKGSEIIWGTHIDPNLADKVQVTTILSGVESPYSISFDDVNPNEAWEDEPLRLNFKSIWD
jgi:cell division protein FtsZ